MKNIYYKHACLHKAAAIVALLTVSLAITLLSKEPPRESPADIYARLCENATAPWKEPTPIPAVAPRRPNFAQSMLEIQTVNR